MTSLKSLYETISTTGEDLIAAVDAAGEFVETEGGYWVYQDAYNLTNDTEQHMIAEQLRDIADELDYRNGVCPCCADAWDVAL